MSKVLYETDYALLTYTQENFILELTWKKNCTEDIYQETFNEAKELARNYTIKSFISDMRNEGVVPIGSLRWLKNTIIPVAIELGIVKIAMIINDELFANIYADLIKKSVSENKMAVRLFKNNGEAMAWVTSS
ncbi:MAG: hypothetical protein JXA77_12030 [Bacteroidales bacterium]|nr:hypothetical protein [Bacteroidales bacterium]MBN2821289.1 hypothetical protein [Bacteroidales bacterium]